MMTEISLNILDVCENCLSAGATLVDVCVDVDTKEDKLSIVIEDNGCGMDEDQLASVEDPFFTTRTTRKVGLGIPFFKEAAMGTGGSFEITSKKNIGTKVSAVFGLSSIDRMPLGDISTTIHTLIVFNLSTDFVYTYRYDKKSFVLDTREFKEILGDVSLDAPEVSAYIMDYLKENKDEVDGHAWI